MEEKPLKPKSNYACPPFYYYKNKDLMKIDDALKNGCGIDAPGSLIAYLCHKTSIYAYLMPGKRYDFGNLESYELVKEIYKGVE